MCRPAEGGARLVPIDTPDHLQRQQQLFGVDYRPLLRSSTWRGGAHYQSAGAPRSWKVVWRRPLGGVPKEGRVQSRKGRGLKELGRGFCWCSRQALDKVPSLGRLSCCLLMSPPLHPAPTLSAHRWEQVVDLTYSHRLGSRPQAAEAYTEAVQRLL